jgi:cystathionine gamma-synthase
MPRNVKRYYDNSPLLPVYRNVAYCFDDTAEVIAYHERKLELGRYARYDSPNCLLVEQELADLDECEAALVFTSGMSAITSMALALLKPGDKVLYTSHCYRNIRTLFDELLQSFGIEAIGLPSFCSEEAYYEIERRYDDKCRLLFIESPSNPHLYLADLVKIKSLIGPDTIVAVDSTLSSPENYKPRRFGADLVIHSCSKYIGGHGDLMAGSIAGSAISIDKIRKTRNIIGGILDPESASMIHRSLATLGLRMKSINEKGIYLAEQLASMPEVRRVYYTGILGHPNFDLATACLEGHGGVVSFELDGSASMTSKFIDAIKLPFMGSNFGSDISMIEQPRVFTYYACTNLECHQLGISDSLVRLSIGLRDSAEMLVADIRAALDQILVDNSHSNH